LRLRPDQDGVFIRDGIKARFQINHAGFNNPRNYTTQRDGHTRRIAVVGDSFVEAFHVDYRDSLFAVLEDQLGRDGLGAEVYSFGVSGFGTSQVYHLVKDYVLAYSPDLVVYLFIRNDVSDSSACLARQPWTQQYDAAPDGEIAAVPFERYELSPINRLLRHSRLFRYLFYQRRLLERIRTWEQPSAVSPAVAADPCADRSWHIVETLLLRLDALLQERGIPWLLIWQGDNDPAYAADIREGLERAAAPSAVLRPQPRLRCGLRRSPPSVPHTGRRALERGWSPDSGHGACPLGRAAAALMRPARSIA
jgi:hypothetical protein